MKSLLKLHRHSSCVAYTLITGEQSSAIFDRFTTPFSYGKSSGFLFAKPLKNKIF